MALSAHIMLTIAYGIVDNGKGVYCKFGLGHAIYVKTLAQHSQFFLTKAKP